MPFAVHPHPDCGECNAYLARRASALTQHIIFYARMRDMASSALLVEFVRGVHARHLSGLSLAVSA